MVRGGKALNGKGRDGKKPGEMIRYGKGKMGGDGKEQDKTVRDGKRRVGAKCEEAGLNGRR